MNLKVGVALVAITFGVGFLGYDYFSSGQVISQTNPISSEQLTVIEEDGLIPEKSITELTGDSEVILRGSVKELLASKWTNPNGEKGPDVRNVIQTDIVVEIDEVFKGVPYNKKSIVVRIDKGQVDSTLWQSDGYPDFVKGEEMVLFLSKDDSDIANPQEQYYVLTGMKQGKFALDKNAKSNKRFTNGRDELALSDVKETISKELEKYKKLPKKADPKIYKP